MKTVHIRYTVFDIIEVPDNWTDEEIYDAVFDNAADRGGWGMVDDADWKVVG